MLDEFFIFKRTILPLPDASPHSIFFLLAAQSYELNNVDGRSVELVACTGFAPVENGQRRPQSDMEKKDGAAGLVAPFCSAIFLTSSSADL